VAEEKSIATIIAECLRLVAEAGDRVERFRKEREQFLEAGTETVFGQTQDAYHVPLVPKRDPNQQAAKAVEKITGSKPGRTAGSDSLS
jgi:hypothetical protein